VGVIPDDVAIYGVFRLKIHPQLKALFLWKIPSISYPINDTYTSGISAHLPPIYGGSKDIKYFEIRRVFHN
jgi:hypothetical protein